MRQFAFAAVTLASAALLVATSSGQALAGNPSPCGQMVTQSGPVPDNAPPSAPAQGQTVQSRSVQPAAPAAVPMTYARPMYYGSASRVYHPHSRYRDIEMRRLHPSNHFSSLE